MKRLSLSAILLSAALFPNFALAAETADTVAPKFKVWPTGRILADGAVYTPDGGGLTSGVALTDTRIGIGASYGKWSALAMIGYGYFKFTVRDVYLQYQFDDENSIKGGNFIQQFGLQGATSSSYKPGMEPPVADSFMAGTGYKLGIQYQLSKPKFFMATSVVFGNSFDLTADKVTRTGVGALGRFVWRPVTSGGTVVQLGMSAWYQLPQYKRTNVDGKGQFSLGANFPTRVVKVPMIGADITHAGNQVKLSPELLLSKGRVALESQYYYMNINRHRGLPNYQAHACYAWLRFLAFGEKSYKYNSFNAGLNDPTKNTLEIVAGYDYVDASHKGVHGGYSNDASLTLNYFLNKYVICRLGYRYCTARDSERLAEFGGRRHTNIFQARVQFRF